jgi:GDP-L-fucose synthase
MANPKKPVTYLTRRTQPTKAKQQFDLHKSKILLTGGNGFLGDYVTKHLDAIGVPKANVDIHRGRHDGDLTKPGECYYRTKGKDIVIHLAAHYGGLSYNKAHPAEVYLDNALMGLHLAQAAKENGVKKFVLAGTVNSYPEKAQTPFREEEFWDGLPEHQNDAYGLSKKMVGFCLQKCRARGLIGVHLVLANLYGPRSYYEGEKANVIPATIHKMLNNEPVEIKGVRPSRDFLHAQDAARAIVLAAQRYNGEEPINIGSGKQTSILELYNLLSALTGYKRRYVLNRNASAGQPNRWMDVRKAHRHFGFKAQMKLEDGLRETVAWLRSYLNTP